MLLLLLFFTGFFAGTVDAIAGGGGLISLPILLSIGMPPHLALGTNKLQGVIGTLVATNRYYRRGLISIKTVYTGLFFGLLGAISGAIISQLLSGKMLQTLILFLLFIILIYTLFSPRLGHQDRNPRMHETWFYLLFGFGLGFYDGFLGPGVGSFWTISLVFFLGYNLVKATAYTKLFNLNSSLIALVCFMFGRNVDYHIALCMAAGQLLGGRLGASLAIEKGAELIRPLFLFVVFLTLMNFIYHRYSNAPLWIHITKQHSLALQIVIGMFIIMSVLAIYLKKMKRQA